METTARHLDSRIKDLPTSLEEIYPDMIKRLRNQPCSRGVLAERVLIWLAYAEQPLAPIGAAAGGLDRAALPSVKSRALLEASKNGHYEVAKLLLDRGAGHDSDAEGMTPLHHAAHSSHLEITRLLVRERANIDAIDQKGRSPLCLASEGGNTAIIRLLVEMGAEIDSIDTSGRTALDQAAENGHPEVLRYLIHHGARTNSSDFDRNAKHRQVDG